jgi:hypothetical protein
MKKLFVLPLLLIVLVSMFVALPVVIAAQTEVEYVVVVYAKPPVDNSMINPDYALLDYHWHSTIGYYVNPTNSYGWSDTEAVNVITTSTNTWDAETSYQVFSYKGTTVRKGGIRDGYNVVSGGKVSQANAIAVTFTWAIGNRVIETDTVMNLAFSWSLKGEPGKMDAQNILTHEFGHWCGLKDLYADKDYWLTMYGYAKNGETYKRTLGLGDINGLRAVYGA